MRSYCQAGKFCITGEIALIAAMNRNMMALRKVIVPNEKMARPALRVQMNVKKLLKGQ